MKSERLFFESGQWAYRGTLVGAAYLLISGLIVGVWEEKGLDWFTIDIPAGAIAGSALGALAGFLSKTFLNGMMLGLGGDVGGPDDRDNDLVNT